MYTPILEEFAKENDNVTIGKVNVDSNQELALKYGIKNIPTTIVFKDGEKNGNSIIYFYVYNIINFCSRSITQKRR